MELKELIVALSGLMSITGHEGYETDKLSALLSGFDEEITDKVGNHIFVKRCGRENAPRILIDTHFDEIGMIVTDIKEGGFLTVTSVGGLDARTLSSAHVKIYGKRVLDGVMASTPPHLSAGQEKKLLAPDELLIDTGYSKEALSELVRIGTPVGFAPRYGELAGDTLVGKGFDNKACAAIAAKALLDAPAADLAGDVYLVLSVHEETDRIGGTAVGGFAVQPDYAMVIDVNLGFMPGVKKSESVAMGKGPSITRGTIVNRKLTAMTEAVCRREEIPYQIYISPTSTGTNTSALHLVGAGIPVVDVGLPLTSMHTYVEGLRMADAEALCRLVRAFVTDNEIGEVFAV